MAARYGVKKVFLATDDADTVTNLSATCAARGIQVTKVIWSLPPPLAAVVWRERGQVVAAVGREAARQG